MKKYSKCFKYLGMTVLASASLLLLGNVSNYYSINNTNHIAKASYYSRTKRNFDVYLKHHKNTHYTYHHNHKHLKRDRGYFYRSINKLRKTKSHYRRVAIYHHILRVGKAKINEHKQLEKSSGIISQNLVNQMHGVSRRVRKRTAKEYREHNPREQKHLIKRIRYALKKAKYYYNRK